MHFKALFKMLSARAVQTFSKLVPELSSIATKSCLNFFVILEPASKTLPEHLRGLDVSCTTKSELYSGPRPFSAL